MHVLYFLLKEPSYKCWKVILFYYLWVGDMSACDALCDRAVHRLQVIIVCFKITVKQLLLQRSWSTTVKCWRAHISAYIQGQPYGTKLLKLDRSLNTSHPSGWRWRAGSIVWAWCSWPDLVVAGLFVFKCQKSQPESLNRTAASCYVWWQVTH